MTLPDGVAFKLGGDEIKSVIIQAHFTPFETYQKKMKPVGLNLHYTTQKQPYKAGILSLHASGQIKSKSMEKFTASCPLKSDIWPLAFLAHTHDFGQKVTLSNQKSLLGTVYILGQ